MALFEDVLEGGIGTGLIAAVGIAVLTPVLKPVLQPALRSTAKAAIKGGMMAYDYGRQAYSELSEIAGDLAAEARATANEATAPAPKASKHS